MTTKRFICVVVASALLLAGYGSYSGKPTDQPALAGSDMERLRAEVGVLKDQLARLEARATAEKPGIGVPEPAAAAEPDARGGGHSIDVKRYGAKGDGVADDTAALQAALDAAGNDAPWGVRGTRILVPPGEYRISATLKVYRMSFEMVGCGFGNSPAYEAAPGKASVFRWDGPPDTPMMEIRDSYGITIRRVRWEGKVGVAGTTAINLRWVAADQQGTNGRTVIEQCHFGRYSHTGQGIWKGDLAYGVLMDGDNGNNDEFQIARCVFSNCTAAGIRIANTQSVWGSVNDCTISECGVGIESASSLTGYNVCFDACGPDWRINSTAHVSVYGYQSERSRKLAELSPDAALIADGGYIQLSAIEGEAMIDAFPSDTAQVILRHMFFTQNDRSPRPKIRFGPSEAGKVVGLNFRVKVTDSRGLYPDQFDLAGPMWATAPESRGEVEFRGAADKAYHFHNFLRTTHASASTLDTARVDLVAADAAPTTVNSSGPIGVQWTAAKVYAGSGAPDNVIAADVGSLYLRTDGGSGSTLYVKERGSGNSGWVPK